MIAKPREMSSVGPKQRVFASLAEIAQALGHAHRLELLEHLGQGERSVEDLAARANLTLANTSRHLQLLRRAALVEGRRDGKRIYYRLAGDDLVIGLVLALSRVWRPTRSLTVSRQQNPGPWLFIEGVVPETDRAFSERMNDRSDHPNEAANLPLGCDERSTPFTEGRDSPGCRYQGARFFVERIALSWTFAPLVLVVVPPDARCCRAGGKEMGSIVAAAD